MIKLADVYIKVSTSKEIKQTFNDFFKANKDSFITKSNMFRMMVFNLPMLVHENFIVDPEKEKLEKELQKANLKIEQLEKRLELEKLNSKKNMTANSSEEITSQLKNMETQLTEIINQNNSQKEMANKLNDIETILTEIVNQKTPEKPEKFNFKF